MEKTTKKLQKLTKQEKIFAVKVAETGNLTKSTQEAFEIEDPNYAGVKGHRLIRKDKIQNAIMSIAEQIPDEDLVRVHLEGLNASDKVTDKEGNVLLEKPDYAVRHKYLDSAYKIKRLYGEEQKETTKENVYNFFFEPKFQQNIRSYDENLKNLILNKDENNKQD